MTTAAASSSLCSSVRLTQEPAAQAAVRVRDHRNRGGGDRSRDRHRARADHRRQLPEVRRCRASSMADGSSAPCVRTTRSTSRSRLPSSRRRAAASAARRILSGHPARADERDRPDAQGRHALDGAIDSRHGAGLVLDLRRGPAVARLRRRAPARRAGLCGVRTGRAGHGRRPQDSGLGRRTAKPSHRRSASPAPTSGPISDQYLLQS